MREMAVRQGSRSFAPSDPIRQLLIESLLLAVVGSALGALLAAGVEQLACFIPQSPGDPLFLDLSFDWRLLGFAAAVAALTCVLFGLTPALRATRIEPERQ